MKLKTTMNTHSHTQTDFYVMHEKNIYTFNNNERKNKENNIPSKRKTNKQ